MTSASSSLSAKEANMFGYEILVKFVDGDSRVFTIDANSIDEAFSLLGEVEGMTSSQLLGTIDRKPQVFLAW